MKKPVKKALVELGCVVALFVLLVVLAVVPKRAPEEVRTEPEHTDVVVTYDGTVDLTATPARVTVVDFNATWCGPCRQLAPIFHAVAAKHQGEADFYSVDVDEHPELAELFGINAIPKIVVLFPDGSQRESIGLVTSDELETLIAQ